MTSTPPLPTIDFYARRNCAVCEEARSTLQQALEDRARSGRPTARVRYHDVDNQPELTATHGPFVPILAVGDRQLQLTSSYRAIAHFLDLVLARLT